MVVWEIGGLDDGSGVPIDPEPGEGVDGLVDDPGLDAWGVEVLDAEDDGPVVLSCEGPVD